MSMEIKPKSGATSSNTWVIDRGEIKPKSGANSNNTWKIGSDRIEPKYGASSSNRCKLSRDGFSCSFGEFKFDGKYFSPKHSSSSQDVLIIERGEIKPKNGATSSNTFVYDIGIEPLIVAFVYLLSQKKS